MDASPAAAFIDRGSRHGRATRTGPSTATWPAANRRDMTSAGTSELCSSASGARTSSATAASYVRSMTRSMTRPARLRLALLYEANVPGGLTCSSPAIDSTYRASASSPSPVSRKWSPAQPAVWLSSWRTVTRSAAAASRSRSSGT